MGTRNRFNPCHPCCVDVDPCTDCGASPPDPLPVMLSNVTPALIYTGLCMGCNTLNSVLLLDRIQPCFWQFSDTLICDGYGTPVTAIVQATLQSIYVLGVRKVYWSVTVGFSGPGIHGGDAGALWTFRQATAAAVPPIDCDATHVLSLHTFWLSDAQTMFCDLRNATCQIN